MESVFRESKRKEHLRLYFEELMNDPDFIDRVNGIKKLIIEQKGITNKIEKIIYELAKEHGLPINGPVIQFIQDGHVKDYSIFDACIVEFPYMEYANEIAAQHMKDDDYRLKSHLENFPIQIQVAADASSNEIKDCISVHLKLIMGWQRFMPPKHWKKTRKSPRAKRNAYILKIDRENPEVTNEEIARVAREEFPQEACDPDIVSKIRNRTRKKHKRS
ncbi:MAG: hypothetical protein ABIH36_00195 [bacterium]